MLRIGEGYDVHRLAEGRPLMIGCVEVAAPKGSVGHSDGDVVAHAICDAVLGALAAGDIGRHFPPSDERWRGVSSRRFLAAAAELLATRGGSLVNLDATVVLQTPKIGPSIDAMRTAVASALGCDVSRISIKAKTAEGLGWIGEGEAIEARAVVLVELPDA